MVDISIVDGGNKLTYNWGYLIVYYYYGGIKVLNPSEKSDTLTTH